MLRLKKRRSKKRGKPLGGRRRKIFRIKILAVVLFVIAIIVLAAWLLRLPNVTISTITIEGNNVIKTEAIEPLVEEVLSGTYLFLVPKKNAFFLPRNKVVRVLEDVFTRVEEVEVDRPSLTEFHVTIIERRPFALWCGETYINTEEEFGHCYFIDEKSLVFSGAPDFTGNIFFKYFGELSATSTKDAVIGGTYMPENEFNAYQVFIAAYDELDYTPVSLTRVDETDFELRLDTGAAIIFGNDASLNVVLDNLESVVDSDAFIGVDIDAVEYIDLRFGSKVYYKLKGEADENERDLEEPLPTFSPPEE